MKKYHFLLFVFINATINLFSAEKLMLPFFDTYNLKSEYRISATKLFKSYLESSQKFEVKLTEQIDTSVVEKDIKKMGEVAKQMGCTKFILGDLNRLGETVMISINLYNAETGEKEWSGIDKALTPDDFDPIFQRIASSLINGGIYDENIYTVTNYDTKALNKKQTSYLYGAHIGGGVGTIGKMDNPFPAGIGVVFSYDSRMFIFDLIGELYFSDIDYQMLTINIVKPINDKDISPYINGALSYGGLSFKQKYEMKVTEAGLLIQLGGGLMLSRTSDVNLRIGGKAVLPAMKIDNGYPAMFMISVILNFKGI